MLSTELGGTEHLYLSAQLLFDSSGAVHALAREGTKKGPTSVEPLRPREVVSDFYAIGDSSLRMICLSSGPHDTRARQPPVRAPREHPLYPVAFKPCK